MKRMIWILVIVCVFFMSTGCGDNKVINGKMYKTYGLLDADSKAPNIVYEPIWGNIVLGSILFSTIFAPIYFFGFSLYEPVGLKG